MYSAPLFSCIHQKTGQNVLLSCGAYRVNIDDFCGSNLKRWLHFKWVVNVDLIKKKENLQKIIAKLLFDYSPSVHTVHLLCFHLTWMRKWLDQFHKSTNAMPFSLWNLFIPSFYCKLWFTTSIRTNELNSIYKIDFDLFTNAISFIGLISQLLQVSIVSAVKCFIQTANQMNATHLVAG